MTTTPEEIRATVGSFYLNSLEAELLACIALALADVSEHLSEIYRLLGRAAAHPDVALYDGELKTEDDPLDPTPVLPQSKEIISAPQATVR